MNAINLTNNNIANSKQINLTKKKLVIPLISLSIISSLIMSSTAIAASNKAEISSPYELSQANHEAAKKREHIGFGVGAVIGGVLAGPIGAMATGLAGNFIANYINSNEEIDTLAEALTNKQEQHEIALHHYQQTFEDKLQQVEQSYQSELLALEHNYSDGNTIKAQQLLMSLQFSTGSSDIAPHYQEQVAVLAQLLNSDASLTIDLSGYTDLVGEESLNQNLSLARVSSVKTLLMAQGVDESRIKMFAFGEQSPLVANHENQVSFYDRRVVLKVNNENTQTAKK